MKRIVFRVDDAASCVEANRGIEECIDAGIARCVSVMAPCAALEDAAERLRNRPGIDIGLHVTLNAEWETVKWKPLLPPGKVPSLVNADGYFLPMPADMKARGTVVVEAMAEVAAQLKRLRAVGLNPSYLDEHCLVGWIDPELVAALESFCRQEGLLSAARRMKYLPGNGLDFVTRATEALDGDYLVVSHPAKRGTEGILRQFHLAGQPDDGSVGVERDAEYHALCHSGLKQDLEDAGIVLVSYTEVLTE